MGFELSRVVPRDLIVPLGYTSPNASFTWTDMPLALTEFLATSRTRTKLDLTRAISCRLLGNIITAGTATAELRLQYSSDQASWSYIDGGTGPALPLVTGSGILVVSAWVTVAVAARSDMFLRLIGINGDGAVDPSFNAINAQFRFQ